MITVEEAQRLVEEKDDYVNIRRFKKSLKVILRRYPDGTPDHIIAQALSRTEEEITKMYDGLIVRFKQAIKREGIENVD